MEHFGTWKTDLQQAVWRIERLKNTEIEQISNTLKGTKIEQGISYLPTALEDLRQMLGKLWEEGIENKILPVLKEMVRRGGVTIEQFLTLLKGELRSENYHPF